MAKAEANPEKAKNAMVWVRIVRATRVFLTVGRRKRGIVPMLQSINHANGWDFFCTVAGFKNRRRLVRATYVSASQVKLAFCARLTYNPSRRVE